MNGDSTGRSSSESDSSDGLSASSLDGFEFDAFLSYSTEPDYKFARNLESFLEQFHTLPTLKDVELRQLRICRDGRDFNSETAQ